MARFTFALVAGLMLVSTVHAGRELRQIIPTGTVAGTNVLTTNVLSRTGAGGVLANQIQAGAASGSTANTLATIDQTRVQQRASPSQRATVATNQAQAAIQQAVRTNNAAGGTKAGAGIALTAAQGAGNPISTLGARATTAQAQTSAAVQSAARGVGTAAQAAATGATSAINSQISTNFGNPAGRR